VRAGGLEHGNADVAGPPEVSQQVVTVRLQGPDGQEGRSGLSAPSSCAHPKASIAVLVGLSVVIWSSHREKTGFT
jgi:hypothetical protein